MQHISDHFEIGKCKSCNKNIYNVDEMIPKKKKLKMKYDIMDILTTIIDEI